MKNEKRIIYIFISLIIIVFFLIPLIVNGLFSVKAPVSIMEAKWNAGEALAYFAGALAFLGTTYLGYVSWKQNQDLHKVEREQYVFQNSCLDIVTKLVIKDMYKLSVNFKNRPEQIVKSKDLELKSVIDYNSFVCSFEMKRTKNVPALIRVNSLMIFMVDNKDGVILDLVNIDDTFSRISIFENKDAFDVTVLINHLSKEKLIKCLNDNSSLILNITYELVTADYVATEIKCIAKLYFDGDESKKDNQSFNCQDSEPRCFWLGNRIINRDDIKIGH